MRRGEFGSGLRGLPFRTRLGGTPRGLAHAALRRLARPFALRLPGGGQIGGLAPRLLQARREPLLGGVKNPPGREDRLRRRAAPGAAGPDELVRREQAPAVVALDDRP